MDWSALKLSLELSFWTMLILLPVGVFLGRHLAWTQFRSKSVVEALLTLPLVLPPTVLGFYLLVAMGARSPIGQAYESLFGQQLSFSFAGLLIASLIFNLPFAHTLGEFGVVLMVGGSIPGETRTIAISIYDRVQAFDNEAAATMSAVLLIISLAAISLSYFATSRLGKRHDHA